MPLFFDSLNSTPAASIWWPALLLVGIVSCTEQPVDTPPTSGITQTAVATKPSRFQYPDAKRETVIDNYHGTDVADPYRWLESGSDDATRAWVKAQNDFAEPYLAGLSLQKKIRQRMTELWNYERQKTPERHGKYYFFRRNDGLQDQDILYVSEALGDSSNVLLDPNKLSEDRTVALFQVEPSRDGSLVAYSLSDGGSDWRTWHVRNTATGEDLATKLTYTKFTSVSWLADNSGFYYSRYPQKAPGVGDGSKTVSVYLHKLGTAQSADELIYQLPDEPEHDPYATISADNQFLVISVHKGYKANAIHVLDKNGKVHRPLDQWDAIYDFLGNDGELLYFRTTHDAPTWRIVGVPLSSPAQANWLEIVPAREETMESASFVGGKFIATYLKDAQSLVQVFDQAGTFVKDIQLPGIGTVSGFDGGAKDTETFFQYQSFTQPPSIYRYDITLGKSELFNDTEISAPLDDYVTKQEFFESKDGTPVPMFIVHHKNITLSGRNPTLLYGYGGFDISLTPKFQVPRIVWLEMGGVLAVPNLRGGGEYGQSWHQAGTKLDKQNVFDDFIAAAEYLITQDYTSPSNLGIAGRSNGGLLVGAVMTQRPDLFGAALPAVGVLDMLRYHTPSANARSWSSDYGLSENLAEFKALYAYSPLHNVSNGTCYPPTFVTTADRDDRVVPWHSYKFTAALQHAQGCDHPILTRVETRAGHGAGKPIWMTIEDYAYQWAFLAEHLGVSTYR